MTATEATPAARELTVLEVPIGEGGRSPRSQ